MSTKDEEKFVKLKKFNASMAVIHLLQAVLILILSSDFSVPIKSAYLRFDEASETLVQETDVLFDLRLGPLVALFLLISAVDHFLMATVLYPWYVKNLKKNINYARWIEYAFSASVMIVVIATLSGMYDIVSLIMIFTLTAVMSLCGLMMELHNQSTEKTNWTAFKIGSIAGFVPWLVIGLYFLFAETATGGQIPTFVYVIYVTIALAYNSFAVNMYLQYKKVGPWKDYLFGENVYIILSLVAKTALAWQVFSGTLSSPERPI